MEKEQKRGEEDERKEESRRRSSETGAKTKLATTLSVAKEANASAGDNQACSDGRCREDKCGSSKRAGGRAKYGGFSEIGPLCYRGRLGPELLCGGFGHMAYNYRNRGQRERVVENRRVEYGGGRIKEIPNFVNNLKEEENLELLN